MSNQKARQDMDKYLETRSQRVFDNVEIITPEDHNGYPYMLHVSKNTNIKEFIPQIGDRQGTSEDRTTPKICVAPAVYSALMGYAMMFDENVRPHLVKEESPHFKGGYVVYAFDYRCCLRPNKKLVYDADMSDEHWLVAYNEDTSSYKGKQIAKFFVNSLIISKVGSDKTLDVAYTTELYIEVMDKDHGLQFTHDTILKKGYYRSIGPDPLVIRNYKSTKSVVIETISETQYKEKKKLSAALLSAPVPSIINKW
jgi:hypothetical protein